jgi:hypothetical protein
MTPIVPSVVFVLAMSARMPGQTDWFLRQSTGPSPRETALAYDSVRGVSVLHGGFGPPTLGDTWEWDGASWRRFSGPGPTARSGHALVYDDARRVTTLFGGHAPPFVSFGDTWVFDGQAWTHITNTGPAPRSAHSMAYDTTRGRVVLFGGADSSGINVLRDTGEWDGQAWHQLRPNVRPQARGFSAMAYDRARGRTVLFGGWNGNIFRPGFDDTWEWDGQNWVLAQPTTRPPGRMLCAMGYDESRRRVVLFGGLRSLGALATNDTWEWDGAEWTRRTTSTSPSGRYGAAMTYDRLREAIVVFGGVDNDPRGGPRPRDDTWEYYTRSPASYATFGQSCAASQTTPTLAPRDGDRPWLDDTMTVELRDLPAGQPVVMNTGFSDSMWGNLRLPFPLDGIGMTGCVLYTPPDIGTSLPNLQGYAAWTLPLPNDAALIGLQFFNQGLVLDPGANPLGVVATNGGAGTIGAR